MEALGSPQKAYRTIHVVGTNGKSSTTRFISALLQARGSRWGPTSLRISISLAERQMVDSVPSTDEEFCELVDASGRWSRRWRRRFAEGEQLTQFEVLTAAAFLYFKEQGCDVAVIEAGLGGRLDATAVISSEVQVLTSIGLEHTELLGDTPLGHPAGRRRRSSRRRAGSWRGCSTPELKAELKEFCAAREAECYFLGDEFVVLADPRAESFDIFGLYGCYTDLRLKVLGGYQRANAAVAVAAVELFNGGRAGRRLVRDGPGVHRRARAGWRSSARSRSASSTGRTTRRAWRRRCARWTRSSSGAGSSPWSRSCGTRKPLEMMRHLAPRCDIIFATQSSSPRALTADELAAIIAEVGQGAGGLRRPRPALGHGERVPAGDLQPGGAGHRVAHPHLGPQAGTELGSGCPSKAEGTGIPCLSPCCVCDHRGGILYRRLRPCTDPDLGGRVGQPLRDHQQDHRLPVLDACAVRLRCSASVVLWLVLVFWTYKDARKRIDDPIIVGVAVLTSLVLPYMGTLIYAILRPAEYLAEARERELEMRAMEQELQTMRACPSCGELIRPDYVACPSCRRPCARPVPRVTGARAGLEAVPVLRARSQGQAGALRRSDEPTRARRSAAVAQSRSAVRPRIKARGRSRIDTWEEAVVERTLVLVKPNGVARGLIGEVIGRLERRGLTIKAARMLMVTEDLAGRHYAEHVGKPLLRELVDFITSGPVFAMVVEGPSAVRWCGP